MGVYVYLYTATPRIKAALPTGETAVLGHYRYGYKPYLFDGDNPKIWQAWTARAQNVFENQVRSKDYAFIGDKPQDGLPIYTNLTSGVWEDCMKFPGVQVGILRKRGRSWTVEPCGQSVEANAS